MVLRRGRRSRQHYAVSLEHIVKEEPRRLVYVIISGVLKEFLVAGEEPVLPHRVAEPCSAERPQSPDTVRGRRESVYIRHMMQNRAAAAVIILRGLLSALEQVLIHVIEERQGAVGQVRGLRVPVVHLEIDVRMIVRVPGSGRVVVPDALKMRRKRSRSARRDEKILSEPEI